MLRSADMITISGDEEVASINPHLLYNTLSSIKWCVVEKGDEDIAHMIDHLIGYYRVVLSEGQKVITIKEELYLVDRYIKIIEDLYMCRFTVIMDIDEALMDCVMVKLIFQPFVENALMHGLNGVENGVIILKARRNNDDIFFSVSDNGYGMTEEQLKKVLTAGKTKKGYGIKNTLNRIKTYYGEDYGITISSTPGEGTEVSVHIKYMTEKDLLEKM